MDLHSILFIPSLKPPFPDWSVCGLIWKNKETTVVLYYIPEVRWRFIFQWALSLDKTNYYPVNLVWQTGWHCLGLPESRRFFDCYFLDTSWKPPGVSKFGGLKPQAGGVPAASPGQGSKLAQWGSGWGSRPVPLIPVNRRRPRLLSAPVRSPCFWPMFPPCVAAEEAQPVASVTPSELNVQQGQRAEFRCSATGKPTPGIEWIGTTLQSSPRWCTNKKLWSSIAISRRTRL